MRGGHLGPNYDRDSIAACERALAAAGLTSNIMIDCSHANSGKDPRCAKWIVARDAAAQIKAGNRSIMGLMIESNINAGNQKLAEIPRQLAYGVSVTDPCIDWSTTADLLRELADGFGTRSPNERRSGASARRGVTLAVDDLAGSRRARARCGRCCRESRQAPESARAAIAPHLA